MTLKISDISSAIFASEEGSEFLKEINKLIEGLIRNDIELAQNNSYAPKIWECKWLNDPSIDGYDVGEAVWMNTFTPSEILTLNYEHVLSYVQNNAALNSVFSTVNTNDPEATNSFLLNAINGTVPNTKVSAIYALGNIVNPVQIMVSKVQNNKMHPTDTKYWEPFYQRSTRQVNEQLMLSVLSSEMSSQIGVHVSGYHPSDMTDAKLESMGFFKKDQLSAVQMQHFYDHTYCSFMEGCDYVASWTFDSTKNSWCKIWKSGYVEQGGYVENNGNKLIRVDFKQPYNYPVGQSFYQDGYDRLPGTSQNSHLDVGASIQSINRYVFSVTPTLKANVTSPYIINPTSSSGVNLYATVDVTNIDNSGFSIVNLDVSKQKYSKYSWHVAGYVVMN